MPCPSYTFAQSNRQQVNSSQIIAAISHRMDKEAMDKYYNYIKNYYPPTTYPPRHPYYSLPHQEEKDRKSPDNYSQMYGYPPYSPYQMPPMGYSQHYPTDHQQDKREEDRSKHEMPNPYGSYYPYSPYPYYNPYAYPPYYYAQRDYANKSMPMQSMGMSSMGMPSMGMPSLHGQHPAHSLYSAVSQVEPSPSPMKLLSKPPSDKAVKQEIVISSDSQSANRPPVVANAPHPPPPPPVLISAPSPAVTMPQPVIVPPPPINPTTASFASLIPLLKPATTLSKPQKMQQEKSPIQRKEADMVNIEEQVEKDPFLIRKKLKISKQDKAKAKGKNFPPERQRQINTRYAGMPSQIYQEMVKKQARMKLEVFYQRERQRKQQQRSKDNEKSKDKELPSKDLKDTRLDKIELQEVEAKRSGEDKSDKDKKDKDKPVTYIPRISAPTTPPEEVKRERERIKDDHPLKELRYNESHGRIRLGAYFQSTIPSLLRREEVAARKVDLQKKLRQREVAAVTF